MKPKFTTIGVYGFSESAFFEALVKQGVDTFCDIRLRRGVRGSKYAFVNSSYLQNKLRSLGIQYIHAKELAPSQKIRSVQQNEDKSNNVKKRDRLALSQAFIREYEQETLSQFDTDLFVNSLGPQAQKVVLFCVEEEPEACHRSLVAQKISKDLGSGVEHIRP